MNSAVERRSRMKRVKITVAIQRPASVPEMRTFALSEEDWDMIRLESSKRAGCTPDKFMREIIEVVLAELRCLTAERHLALTRETMARMVMALNQEEDDGHASREG